MYRLISKKRENIYYISLIIIINFISKPPLNMKYIYQGDDIFSVSPILRQVWLEAPTDTFLELFKYRLYLQRILSLIYENIEPNSIWPFLVSWTFLTLSAIFLFLILKELYGGRISLFSTTLFLIFPREETFYKLSGLGYTILVFTLILIIYLNTKVLSKYNYHLVIFISIVLIIFGYMLYENGLLIALSVLILLFLNSIYKLIGIGARYYWAYSIYIILYFSMFVLQTLVEKPHYLRNPNVKFENINQVLYHGYEILVSGNKYYLTNGLIQRFKSFANNLDVTLNITYALFFLISVIVFLALHKLNMRVDSRTKNPKIDIGIIIFSSLLVVLSPMAGYTLVSPGESEFPWRLSILIPIGLAFLSAAVINILSRLQIVEKYDLTLKIASALIMGISVAVSYGEYIGYYAQQKVYWRIIDYLSITQIEYLDKIELEIDSQYFDNKNKYLIDGDKLLHHIHLYGTTKLSEINGDVDVYNQIITCVGDDSKRICITNQDDLNPKYEANFNDIIPKL